MEIVIGLVLVVFGLVIMQILFEKVMNKVKSIDWGGTVQHSVSASSNTVILS